MFRAFVCAAMLAGGAAHVSGQACAASRHRSRAQLVSLLRAGRFRNPADSAASFRLVGCYHAGRAEVGVYHYQRVWGSQRMTQRLVFISSTRGYLGMYAVDDPPTRVEERRIAFPYPAREGNVIPLAGGRPPAHPRVNGQVLSFSR